MNISRETSWAINEILLWQIAKKLEQLNKIAGSSVTTTTSTTTIP